MKTTIKILAALAVMMGFSMSVMGQDGKSDQKSIDAKATVMVGVKVTSGTPLDFKNVVPGVPKTIDFKNTVTAGTATVGETTGYWTIEKGTFTQITVAINTADHLNLTSDANNLSIAYTGRLRAGDDPSAPSSVSPITDFTNTQTENSGTTKPFFESGKFYVDLGGTVSPSGTQAPGDYSTTLTLTATYN